MRRNDPVLGLFILDKGKLAVRRGRKAMDPKAIWGRQAAEGVRSRTTAGGLPRFGRKDTLSDSFW